MISFPPQLRRSWLQSASAIVLDILLDYNIVDKLWFDETVI